MEQRESIGESISDSLSETQPEPDWETAIKESLEKNAEALEMLAEL